MFLKQYNYKPRSNSQSSGTSGSPPAAKEETPRKSTDAATNTATSPTVSAAVAGRRRSSVDKFAGLQDLKRGGQDDRKASWTEQKAGSPGLLGGMWQNFTKGS